LGGEDVVTKNKWLTSAIYVVLLIFLIENLLLSTVLLSGGIGCFFLIIKKVKYLTKLINEKNYRW
jgi:hypothetical protein